MRPLTISDKAERIGVFHVKHLSPVTPDQAKRLSLEALTVQLPGLDPAIQHNPVQQGAQQAVEATANPSAYSKAMTVMDCRVKPGNDKVDGK